jgi:hypothetical protein
MMKRSPKVGCAANASAETELALNVTVLYQDLLTLRWATELWDRVGDLIGSGGIHCKSWKLSDLAYPDVFAEAMQAAAAAHVLVVSVLDAGELPISFCAWADAWIPRRAGRGGALVTLIGVPPQPSHQSGQAYRYLEAVARRAGLDFLPDERKLPEGSFAVSNPTRATPEVNPAMAQVGVGPPYGSSAYPHWGLNE